MTPLQIDIMLHYFCRADDYRDGDFSAPAVRAAIDYLRDDCGLLVHQETISAGNMYRVTERGRVYVEALQATPLPVQAWAIPNSVA